MKRRKMLAGLGSLAAGGAAAMGTGAFTSVVAERTLAINVTGDASAFLALEAEDTPNGGEYVEVVNGQVLIDLTETTNGGRGVNRNADSKFANLLKICNKGTQEVRVGVDADASSDLIDKGIGIFAEGPQNDGSLTPKDAVHPNGVDYDGDGDTGNETGGGFDFENDPVHLEPGECVENIGVAWDRGGLDFDELDGNHTIIIKAEVLDDGQPGDRT